MSLLWCINYLKFPLFFLHFYCFCFILKWSLHENHRFFADAAFLLFHSPDGGYRRHVQRPAGGDGPPHSGESAHYSTRFTFFYLWFLLLLDLRKFDFFCFWWENQEKIANWGWSEHLNLFIKSRLWRWTLNNRWQR